MEPEVTRKFRDSDKIVGKKDDASFGIAGSGTEPDATLRRYQTRVFQKEVTSSGEPPPDQKEESTMKYSMIAAAAVATMALAGSAYAAVTDQEPAASANSTIQLSGESPSGHNGTATTQGTGGKSADEIAAPTGDLSGSQTGAANMNGPNRDGQPVRNSLKTGDAPMQ